MEILLTFTSVTIFVLMLTIGLNNSLEQLTSLWRKPGVLLRSLIAVLVLVPLLVIVLLSVFSLPPYVVTALAILAAAPGAPLTTKRSRMAGADVTYVSALQLTLALLAIVVTPFLLAVFYFLFDLTVEHISPFDVASQIVWVTFLPVFIGLVCQHLMPKLAALIRRPIATLADVLFLLLVVILLIALAFVPELRSGLAVGWTAAVVIVVMAAGAILLGHALGAGSIEARAGLAIASVARNIGLALYIAELDPNGYQSVPTIVVYMLLGSAVALPYGIWIKGQMK